MATSTPKTPATRKTSASSVKPTPKSPSPQSPATPSAKAAPVTGKEAKLKKPKLVRDSFTMPKDEYAILGELKLRAAKLGHPAKKSELLRAGVKALVAMADSALLAALKAVPAIKTGRPKKT